MSQSEKSVYYKALKEAGVELDKPYQQYTTAELAQKALELVRSKPAVVEQTPVVEAPTQATEPPSQPSQPEPPRSNVNAEEHAGMRLNQGSGEIIRVDDHGRQWIQEEVRKPAFPKPRARRVTKYMDTGTEMRSIGTGETYESFEIAGKLQRPAEIKTTLPTFQTGIYRHPSHPFAIHTYGGREGYDLYEVRDYFGGADLVPTGCKTVYVSNDLCYDIRTTMREIERIYRELQLGNKEAIQ